MASLFISYSRRDVEFARKLTESLKGQELDFWIDWEGIPPTVDWWKEIERGIEQADIFLFLLSPDSAGSKVCKQEIEHAARNGKRLIPVVVRDIKADRAPTELKPLNWIFLRESDDFDAGFNKLIEAVKTDYEWVQAHRQLQVKALEWERNNHGNGFLLHREELQEAEIQLVANSSKEPYPTDLQREYVLKSRQVSDRQRRTLTTWTIAAIITLIGLAVFGFVQAGLATANATKEQAASTLAVQNQIIAEERANIAVARTAAIQAINLRDKQLDVALLLGVEANARLNNYETQSVLFDNLRFSPRLRQFQDKESSLAEDNSLTILRGLADSPFPTIAISPDGKTGATGDDSRIIKLWDLSTKKLIAELALPGPDQYIPITALTFNQDSTKLASGTDNGEIDIWDVAKEELLFGPAYVEDFVTSIAFSNNGNYIAVGESTNNLIGIYASNLDLANEVAPDPYSLITPIGYTKLAGHTDFVTSIVFSRDDRFLASGSKDRKVILWDLEDLGVRESDVSVLIGHKDEVVDLEFSEDEKSLISTEARGTKIVWSVENKDPIEQSFFVSTFSDRPKISPNGTIFAYKESFNEQIVLLDIPTLRTMGIMHASDGNLEVDPVDYSLLSKPETIITHDQFLTFSQDNNILTYNAQSGEFTLWDSATKTPISQQLEPQTGVVAVTFHPEGKIVAIGTKSGVITLLDTETRSTIGILVGHDSEIWDMEFGSTGNLLISSGSDRKVIIWNIDTQQPVVSPLDSNGTMALSADGRILAYGDSHGVPILFDLTEFEAIGTPLKEHQAVDVLSFNRDGNILASSGVDGSRVTDDLSYRNIMLWDVKSQRQIGQTIRSPIEGGGATGFNGIGGIFSSDGKSFVVHDNLGNMALWDINVDSWIRRSCQIAGRNLTKDEWNLYFPDEDYHVTCPQWPTGE